MYVYIVIRTCILLYVRVYDMYIPICTYHIIDSYGAFFSQRDLEIRKFI